MKDKMCTKKVVPVVSPVYAQVTNTANLNELQQDQLRYAEGVVLEWSGLTISELYDRSHAYKYSHPRFMLWFILRVKFKWQYSHIGRVFQYTIGTVQYGVLRVLKTEAFNDLEHIDWNLSTYPQR